MQRLPYLPDMEIMELLLQQCIRGSNDPFVKNC